MPAVLVFDVNETLLDLKVLEPQFEKGFADGRALNDWFHQVILFAEALTLAGGYRPFGEIARAALEMEAEARGVRLTAEQANEIVGAIRRLPPHADVPESLARLKEAGLRMVALSNSPPAVLDAQIENANLKQYFERHFSVEAVRRYKPAPEPYRMVAHELGVDTREMMMIAAHAWDVGGAMQAGCAAAFVARPGKALFSGFPQPEITGKDLREVTESILRLVKRA
jgi:2-haloacid dehalogenase